MHTLNELFVGTLDLLEQNCERTAILLDRLLESGALLRLPAQVDERLTFDL